MVCKLNIQRFVQKNSQISVLFTLTRGGNLGNVYGFVVTFCSIIYYKIFCSAKDCYVILDIVVYVFAMIVLMIFLIKFMYFVKEETLMVTVPLCVQYTKTNRIGNRCVSYIPWNNIRDFVIIEVITGQKVLFYLALLLRMDSVKMNEHIILFDEAKPRLHHLELIYREAQTLIDRFR